MKQAFLRDFHDARFFKGFSWSKVFEPVLFSLYLCIYFLPPGDFLGVFCFILIVYVSSYYKQDRYTVKY